MSNKGIQQLLEIQEAYNENGDIEQVKNSIKKLPIEMQELFNEMIKNEKKQNHQGNKKANTELIKKYDMVSFSDEKGKTYVLGTKEGFDLKINEAASYAIHRLLDLIDDDKIKDKLLNKLKDDKKE